MVRSPSPFASHSDARTAWRRHGAELLAGHSPGERPSAFFEFDLRVPTPSTWWEQLRILLDHKLMAPEEIIAIEAANALLDPQQSTGYNSVFESFAGTRVANLGPVVLRQLAAEFAFAADWHADRNRLELTQRYQRRASCVRVVISQSEVATDDH